ncbi:unnamed protein product [Adineta ricciae]|uniref:LicD/FKTN/FKRP nucleotidyltransferase domain-containing protein n=1 Tax=Adineta ricciae TaxID=249248 RepID=A0A815H7K1_ADIRI|nr:unnamed protein product [Adineta ricciae]
MTSRFYFITSSSHIRSFCLSFFLLAILLTFINFLTTTTTTSLQKLTTDDLNIELNLTTTTLFPLLVLNSKDVHFNRFDCHEQIEHNKNLTVLSKPSILYQPNDTLSRQNAIPYDYRLWQSALSMPRMVTKCEHRIMMQLLKRFDQLTRKYSLEYMIIDGTLLGSWRHHDLIPWDDDIDLMMSVKLKSRLNMAIEAESFSSPYYIEFHRRWDAPKAFEYYKFYFSTSPKLSEHPWRYPFIDLIFYHENSTHLWQENMQHISTISKQKIFPLELRPFGSLWLPSPRLPRDYFHSVNWTMYDHECIYGPWSHKYERMKDDFYTYGIKSKADCKELKKFYPFVERSSTDNDERLVFNGVVTQIMKGRS